MTNDDLPTQRFSTEGAPTRSGLAAGQRVFVRYLLEAQVGRGGMGVVWRAHDEKLDRPVALKFLPPEVAADAEAVRDLKLETRRCLDLTHANIVRVYDFVEEGTSAAIAMEYIEGESLAKIKVNAPGGCLAAADLTPLVAQLCSALRYAHQVAKVAHHDLKPANVLVTRDGVLKITDFGIARSLTETKTRITAKAGTTSGTLHYMSPQQLAGEKPTTADDIYALGAMLYELLTGKPPFFRGDAFTLRQQVLEREPAPLEAHRRDIGCTGAEIPPQWSETILACLAKKPEQRPASADEVAARLGVALEPMATTRGGLTLATAGGRGPAAAPEPIAPRRRSLVPWLLGGGSVLAAMLGAGIYFGVYVPEQQRLAAEAERARQTESALKAELARRAEEKRLADEAQALAQRKKEEEARAQATREQEAYQTIMERIAALSDTSPQPLFNQTGQAVRLYLRTPPPEAFRDRVEKAWAERQAARRRLAEASLPGSLSVETDPAGATVVLYPANERKSSPALFENVKPGAVTVRIEKEGFEAKDVPFEVKPGTANKLPPVALVSTYGSLAITSDPPDLYVLVEGGGKRLEGRTPFNPASLPPATYKVTFQQTGWRPLVKNVIVERGKPAKAFAEMKGVTVEFRTNPPGAQVVVDRHQLGALDKPLRIESLEPRDYPITATLDGYEPYNKTVTIAKNDTVVITLTEKPLRRALHRLTGTRWVYDSFGTSADLTFSLDGKIAGTHHTSFGSAVRDVGLADSFNANTGIYVAKFVALQGKPFYAGNVRIKVIDDDHLELNWNAAGSAERLVFARDKPGK